MPPFVDHDPLAAAMRPPPDESPDARALRLAREAEARKVSQTIDESIRLERQRNKKKRIVRVLLLGQSESGKSTTLRQFQRIYTPTAFREERVHWRAIIQLNLIRSVHTILAALAPAPPPPRPPHHTSPRSHTRTLDSGFDARSRTSRHKHRARAAPDPDPDPDDWASDPDTLAFADDYDGGASPPWEMDGPSAGAGEDALDVDALALRLLPLRHVEAYLKARLVPASDDPPLSQRLPLNVSLKEIFVRPGARPASGGQDEEENQRVIWECRDDLARLWGSERVRAVLRRRRVRVEEESGFFLDDLERITALDYMPSDDDVLKARLKTLGVSEYKFQLEAGDQRGAEWRIVDVGGSRFQRQTWVPFFDDVDAIIFLAPISSFDQPLEEDAKVNRLEDSVLLWKSVCSNKLLANVDLVLFLNKCDILQRKLESGIQLSRYVRSYGDRANDMETASKYFRGKFSAIQRVFSPAPRKFYGFCTSVTDIQTTAGILASVRDIVLRQNLRQIKLA
ncbi:G-alpha-domain-containing protein [Auriscalpium vulgare]|uniref:G-alpha-domain-containing protein n=1 Tax=Auriscalpium vulgare TaxID=40419 RepID=A0ACB8RK97_9AGAM|nr:G-alpha-domain-containing protein [Auriscalpium vulgare]